MYLKILFASMCIMTQLIANPSLVQTRKSLTFKDTRKSFTTKCRRVTQGNSKFVFSPKLKVSKQNNRWFIAERMNSRLAMVGYVCGSIIEKNTGQNYIEQFRDNHLLVLATTLLVAYSTIVTRDVEMVNEEKPFTSNIELLNGRMVMMGMLLKFIYDATSYF